LYHLKAVPTLCEPTLQGGAKASPGEAKFGPHELMISAGKAEPFMEDEETVLRHFCKKLKDALEYFFSSFSDLF
jgi:hypothetical protein